MHSALMILRESEQTVTANSIVVEFSSSEVHSIKCFRLDRMRYVRNAISKLAQVSTTSVEGKTLVDESIALIQYLDLELGSILTARIHTQT